MQKKSQQDGQYHRPGVHFSPRPRHLLPSTDRRSLLRGSALLLGVALLMVLAMIPLRTAPDAATTSRDASRVLAPDCAITQQMTYAPCGHRVTRRIALPQELAGRTHAELTAAYEGWQVTEFSATAAKMERTFAIHCPEHIVLKPDENGMLCAWQNKYGDALSLVKALDEPVGEMTDEVQEELRRGKAFDSLGALEKWLEGAGS